MRIQLCKERYMTFKEFRTNMDKIKKEIDPYWDRENVRPSPYIESGKATVEAYICTNCGTEFFRHCCCIGDFCTCYFPKENLSNKNWPRRFTAEGQKTIRALDKQLNARKRRLREDFERARLPESCPVCGMPLNDELCGIYEGKWDPYDDKEEKEFKSLIESAFSDLKCTLERVRNDQAKEELNKLNLHYEEPANTLSISACKAIQSNPDQLKKYIFNLLQLDSSIETLKNRLSILYAARIENQMEVNIVNSKPLVERRKKIEADTKRFEKAQEAYRRSVDWIRTCKNNRPKTAQIPLPPKPDAPILQQPHFFNKKRVLAQNIEREAVYQQELQEYERKCQEIVKENEENSKKAQEFYLTTIQEAEAAAQKAEQEMENLRVIPENYVAAAPVEVCPEKAKQRMIAEEIQKAETLIKQLNQIEYEMYTANVIYEKYQDFDILSTFYDYLMSGRCKSLEGSNGAYNLYESEYRSDMMITKLSSIERSLRRIEYSQYVISDQLANINHSLERMNETMDAAYNAISDIRANTDNITDYMKHVSENSDVIVYNTAVTAYYTKINASLTDALGFMVALK